MPHRKLTNVTWKIDGCKMSYFLWKIGPFSGLTMGHFRGVVVMNCGYLCHTDLPVVLLKYGCSCHWDLIFDWWPARFFFWILRPPQHGVNRASPFPGIVVLKLSVSQRWPECRSVPFYSKLKRFRWGVPKIMVPQNGWFIMENPIKMDDLGGKPTIFGNTQMESPWNLFLLQATVGWCLFLVLTGSGF